MLARVVNGKDTVDILKSMLRVRANCRVDTRVLFKKNRLFHFLCSGSSPSNENRLECSMSLKKNVN
ncbi:hypothetical protein C0J52_22215 [Blattella germanica]|nr:hypothetical protein C0J52_22215 [Blattella germanica]